MRPVINVSSESSSASLVARSRSGVSCLNHLRLQVESSAETPCTSDACDVLPKVRVNLVVYTSIVALGFKL